MYLNANNGDNSIVIIIIVIITIDICIKFREKSEKIQHITGARRGLAQSHYSHRHSQVANTVHQELAIKCALSNRPPIPYYKYELHSV